jgi:hypothetical protein
MKPPEAIRKVCGMFMDLVLRCFDNPEGLY